MKTKLVTLGAIFVLMFLLIHPIASFAQDTDPCPLVDGKNVCDTAIGKIDANSTAEVVKVIFKYVISVAGVGAMILFLVGGYKVMLSRGDKEKLHEARDTITSAVLGLVFIILSLVILQIIGVNILQIPGFSQ